MNEDKIVVFDYPGDNGGRRSGIDRRHFFYHAHIPERREGAERRRGIDRRSFAEYKVRRKKALVPYNRV